MAAKPDYYRILGVDSQASEQEIRIAFRKKAFEYHPDRNRAADAGDRFKEVNEAYQVLSNSVRRSQYDRSRYAERERAEKERREQIWKEQVRREQAQREQAQREQPRRDTEEDMPIQDRDYYQERWRRSGGSSGGSGTASRSGGGGSSRGRGWCWFIAGVNPDRSHSGRSVLLDNVAGGGCPPAANGRRSANRHPNADANPNPDARAARRRSAHANANADSVRRPHAHVGANSNRDANASRCDANASRCDANAPVAAYFALRRLARVGARLEQPAGGRRAESEQPRF